MNPAIKTHDPMSRTVILGATLMLGAASMALIFAPEEVAHSIGIAEPGAAVLLLELYGAALFGLAMTGWMAKDAVIGGVFGRSYVVGNAAHAFVGAFALLRPAIAPGAPVALRVLTCGYVALAVIFGYLMFAAAPRSRGASTASS